MIVALMEQLHDATLHRHCGTDAMILHGITQYEIIMKMTVIRLSPLIAFGGTAGAGACMGFTDAMILASC